MVGVEQRSEPSGRPMTYPTTARTLLGNIRANLDAIRVRVGPRQVLAAVKANA